MVLGETMSDKQEVNKVHAVFVLDRSSSMSSIGKESVDGLNERLRELKEKSKDVPTFVSLVTFSTIVDKPLIWDVPAEDVEELKYEDFVPSGMTAMYDAVGCSIDSFLALPDAKNEDVAFLMIIISDGQENNSKEYTSKIISEKIKECDATEAWTFVYLGANQDLSQVSKNTGISMGNTISYIASSSGVAERGFSESIMLDRMYKGYSCGVRNSKNAFDNSGDGESTSI
jgi:uncharacterized protein YegL